MNFHINQKVVCVDDSLPNNSWHRAHMVVKGCVYTIARVQHDGYVDIDGSGRVWEPHRFRPVKTTDISIFTALLNPAPSERVKERV